MKSASGWKYGVLSIALLATGIVSGAWLWTTMSKKGISSQSPILPLEFDIYVADQAPSQSPSNLMLQSSAVSSMRNATSAKAPSIKENGEDIFAGKDQSIDILQTQCLDSGNLCEAFSADCCPGLVCVPVNVTESRCSNRRGSICLNIGSICNDAVIGVECCDNAVCTPDLDEVGRSRCVLPNESIQLKVAWGNTPSPSPFSRRSLRRKH